MKKIWIPVLTGVIAVAVGSALLIGNAKKKKAVLPETAE